MTNTGEAVAMEMRRRSQSLVDSIKTEPSEQSNYISSSFTSCLLMSAEMFDSCIYSGCYHLNESYLDDRIPRFRLLSLENSSKTADYFPQSSHFSGPVGRYLALETEEQTEPLVGLQGGGVAADGNRRVKDLIWTP